MGKLGLLVFAILGTSIANMCLSVGLVGGAAGYAFSRGGPSAEMKRVVVRSLEELARLAPTLGPKPRYETISVLDVAELETRRKARASGALILKVGD